MDMALKLARIRVIATDQAASHPVWARVVDAADEGSGDEIRRMVERVLARERVWPDAFRAVLAILDAAPAAPADAAPRRRRAS